VLAEVRFGAHYGLKSDIARGLKSANKDSCALFDHLVGDGNKVRRQFQIERAGGFQVHQHLETGWLLDWQLQGLVPFRILSM
jgi:hypothetical protein